MKPNSAKTIEEEYGITDSGANPYEIPLKGSMGLLILGYRGLMAWRAKRIEAGEKESRKTSNNDSAE